MLVGTSRRALQTKAQRLNNAATKHHQQIVSEHIAGPDREAARENNKKL
jgi:hypothetical protein